MIVVEGFDGSGKSTLAEKISEVWGWPVLHTGGPTKDVPDVKRCLDRSLIRLRSRCVQDRTTYVSEAVYSSLSHPAKAAVALAAIPDMARATSTNNVILIYCRPPTGFLINALAEHQDKEHDPDGHMDRVRREAPWLIGFYDTVIEMVSRQRVTVLRYDRTKKGETDRLMSLLRNVGNV